MRALMDTHVFLWWALNEPHRIGSAARELMEDPATELLLSAASTWELAIKLSKGKLRVSGSLEDVVAEAMQRFRIEELRISQRHTLQVAELPPHHADPFDRLLVAQAQVEQVALLSGDRAVAEYDADVRW
jgi:PIN domain nuclease of toxin-antitoxin system